MRFWDSSALVAAAIPQQGWDRLAALLDEDEVPLVWWGTAVEYASAVARLGRMGQIDHIGVDRAIARLHHLEEWWTEIEPSPAIRRRALELLQAHPLSAGDALQLAAALIAAEGHPAGIGFVCLDRRLADAARREGFAILPE